MESTGILIFGVLIVIVVLGVTSVINAAAPYIAGAIVIVVLLAAIVAWNQPDEKLPQVLPEDPPSPPGKGLKG